MLTLRAFFLRLLVILKPIFHTYTFLSFLTLYHPKYLAKAGASIVFMSAFRKASAIFVFMATNPIKKLEMATVRWGVMAIYLFQIS